MKRFISLAIIALLAISSKVSAQILWKVEKPGNEHVSYVLGTHHFAPLSVLDSLTNLPEALNDADKVYGELDMALSTSPAAIQQMQMALIAPPDSTLDKGLAPAQLDSVKTALEQLSGAQMPVQALFPLKPAAISTQIAAMMSMKLFPELNPMEGIDMIMQQRAKELDKPVDGLETLEFQMNALYGNSIKDQATALMKTISDMNDEERKAIELANSYLNHNIDAIYNAMVEAESTEEDLDRLIYSRNDNWANRLIREMADSNLLVVVGAGHLPGERGVLEQLRKAGYTVTSAE